MYQINLQIDDETMSIIKEMSDSPDEDIQSSILRIIRLEKERRDDPVRFEVVNRFWSKVDRSGGPDSCWEWTGCTADGYGAMHAFGKSWRTHQLAWFLATGEKLHGRFLVIRHKCDNRLCCNPSHLIPGTQMDNCMDRIERRIDQKGSHNYFSKLTEEQVSEIRRRCALGEMQKIVAKDFGLGRGHVSLIVNGKIWKDSYKGSVTNRKCRTLTTDEINCIRNEYNPSVISQNEIAKNHKVSRATVRRIISGEYTEGIDVQH